MMLCTTRASSSLKRFINSHTPSAPVAFLGFRCLSVHLTCPIDSKGGGTSFKRCETVWKSGTSVGQMFRQGLINACCNCSAIYSLTSAGGMQFGESLIVASPYIVLYHFSDCEARIDLWSSDIVALFRLRY